MSKTTFKILLIDDDLDFLEATETILKSNSSYEVITATNGNTGLQMAKDEKPDLILLDVIMPVEDGFTAAKKLKGDHQLQDIPIVMLTSFSQRVGETNLAVRQGMDLEAEDYIEKPVSPQELLRKVEKLLQR
ncbi:PleD family two-component system response regulator [Chloroflexota bacterium]